MTHESHQSDASSPRGYRGPEGLGGDAASALEQGALSGQGFGGVAEESILKQWAEKSRCVIPDEEWAGYHPITNHTSEHEVRYRAEDHRAIKRTWPDLQPHPTDEQIATHLKDRGFEPLFGTLFGWLNADYGYVVLDAKADNFVVTARGVFPIDLLITECQAAA